MGSTHLGIMPSRTLYILAPTSPPLITRLTCYNAESQILLWNLAIHLLSSSFAAARPCGQSLIMVNLSFLVYTVTCGVIPTVRMQGLVDSGSFFTDTHVIAALFVGSLPSQLPPAEKLSCESLFLDLIAVGALTSRRALSGPGSQTRMGVFMHSRNRHSSPLMRTT